MKEIKFKFRDKYSFPKWIEQSGTYESLKQCVEINGLGKDCEYKILSIVDTPKNHNKRLSFVIEHFNGNPYFGFQIEVKPDGSINVCGTKDCDVADIDDDYLFDTDNQLYRIQANTTISHEECDEIISSYNELEGVDLDALHTADDSSDWSKYIMYLMEWAMDHKQEEFEGMCPACFDEWLDNEACFDE